MNTSYLLLVSIIVYGTVILCRSYHLSKIWMIVIIVTVAAGCVLFESYLSSVALKITQAIKGAKGDRGPSGFPWRGEYKENVIYNVNDAVYYQGRTYICLVKTTSSPITADWNILASGIFWRGLYSPVTEYIVGDIAKHNLINYICKKNSVGEVPSSSVKWEPL